MIYGDLKTSKLLLLHLQTPLKFSSLVFPLSVLHSTDSLGCFWDEMLLLYDFEKDINAALMPLELGVLS